MRLCNDLQNCLKSTELKECLHSRLVYVNYGLGKKRKILLCIFISYELHSNVVQTLIVV